jgi:hypothetical protein
MHLSIEEYDALVDAGEIVAWTKDEANAVRDQTRRIRSQRPLRNQERDLSGELAEACRKILSYRLKNPGRNKPIIVPGSGQTWHA